MLAPADAEPVADLAHRGIRANGVDERGQEVLVAARRGLESGERSRPRLGVPTGADGPHGLDLAPLALGVDALQGRGRRALIAVAIDPDDDPVPALDLLLDPVCRLLDLSLLEAGLDRRERAAEGVDLLEVGARRLFQLVRQLLHEIRTSQRVGRLGHAGLVGEDLLRPERETGRLLGR